MSTVLVLPFRKRQSPMIAESAVPRLSRRVRLLQLAAELAAVTVVLLWFVLFASGAEAVYILFVLVGALA